STSEAQLENRKYSGKANHKREECVEHHQCDFHAFAMNIIFHNNLHAKAHVVSTCYDEKCHDDGNHRMAKCCFYCRIISAIKRNQQTNEEKNQRNKCHSAHTLRPEMTGAF